MFSYMYTIRNSNIVTISRIVQEPGAGVAGRRPHLPRGADTRRGGAPLLLPRHGRGANHRAAGEEEAAGRQHPQRVRVHYASGAVVAANILSGYGCAVLVGRSLWPPTHVNEAGWDSMLGLCVVVTMFVKQTSGVCLQGGSVG